MTKRNFEIQEIAILERDGPLRFEHIDPDFYWRTLREWRKDFKITLPPNYDLPKFGRPKDLRLLLNRLTITVTFKNTSWIQVQFDRGYISDLASVPRAFRNFVDNDDIKLAPAALVHDYFFAVHKLSFGETNELFYQMALHNGYNKLRAFVALVSVSSPIGLYRFRKLAKRRRGWNDDRSRDMIE